MSANVTVPPSDGGFPSGLSSDRVTRGTVARWSETTGWVDRDGLPLPPIMLVIGYTTIIRRWVDRRPIDITEHPLPDPVVLNAEIPTEQWEIGMDGRPRPPYAMTYVIYMVDAEKTGAVYTFANSTFGSMLCYTNLEEQVAVMRMLRGAHVFPIVRLSKRPMKTAFGMKTRPALEIIDWRAPGGGGGGGIPAVSPSSAPQLTGPLAATPPTAATPASATSTPSTTSSATPSATPPTTSPSSSTLDAMKPVKPVSVAEVIADELPPWA